MTVAHQDEPFPGALAVLLCLWTGNFLDVRDGRIVVTLHAADGTEVLQEVTDDMLTALERQNWVEHTEEGVQVAWSGRRRLHEDFTRRMRQKYGPGKYELLPGGRAVAVGKGVPGCG